MLRTSKKTVYAMIIMLLLTLVTGCSSKKKETSNSITPAVTEAAAKENPLDKNSSNAEAAAQTSEDTTEVTPEAAVSLSKDEISKIHLKDIYGKYGIKVGTCLSDQMITSDAFTNIINSQFNSVTLENLMKPDYIFNQEKSKDQGDLVVEFNDNTRALLDWAKENGMKMRGHTLVWYSQTPSWIFYDNFDPSGTLVDRDTMLKRMDSYIKQVFEQIDSFGYTDLFYAYDVVNEALMEDGSYRSENNLWYKIIGEDYIWNAFNDARKYAPKSIALFYNDYNEQYKKQAIVDLVHSLVDKDGNSLIDGLGLQAHLYTADDLPTYLDAVKAFCDLGIQLQLTELDVGLGSYQKADPSTDENFKNQGQYYYQLLQGILDLKKEKNANITAVTFWGFADRLSWRSQNAPLLYNNELQEKYSFFAAAGMKEYAGY